MIVYGDASALIKRYLAEVHGDRVRAWTTAAELVVSSRIAYVEVKRAVGRSGVPDVSDRLSRFEQDWRLTWVVDVTQPVAESAANLALHHELRSLDAIHLASALTIALPDLHVATFDEALWRAAREVGLNVLPETLP